RSTRTRCTDDAPSDLPAPRRFPHDGGRATRDSEREAQRIRPHAPRREGQPAQPQEGRELTKQESDRKPTTPPTNRNLEERRVEGDRQPHHRAADQNTARARRTDQRRDPRRQYDEDPVARLQTGEVTLKHPSGPCDGASSRVERSPRRRPESSSRASSM